jgi:formylglycine-generating enzyme required for sulfatase activity
VGLWQEASTAFAEAEAWAKGVQTVRAAKGAFSQDALGVAQIPAADEPKPGTGLVPPAVQALTAEAERLTAEGKWTEAAAKWQEATRVLLAGFTVTRYGKAVAAAEGAKARGDWGAVRAVTAALLAAAGDSGADLAAAAQASVEKARALAAEAEEELSKPRLPPDLVAVTDAGFASLDGLAEGSADAQAAQKQACVALTVPVEVKTKNTGIVFRLVPAGIFTMGSPGSEQDAIVDAGLKRESVASEAQHWVTITQPYWCGKFEVTQAQWEAVMDANPARFTNAGREAPVEQVSWEECQGFLRKLCQREDVEPGTYRLLTEAEWEHACRAGTSTSLYTGELRVLGKNNSSLLGLVAWYGGNSGVDYAGAVDSSGWPEKQIEHSRAGPHPVGGKLANAYGLHDMIGNVWEWCRDWAGDYQDGAVTDPAGSSSGPYRVYRGGGWNAPPGCCRAAHRHWSEPGVGDAILGLRLARSVGPSTGERGVSTVPQRVEVRPPAAPAPTAPPAPTEARDVPRPPGRGLPADLVAVGDSTLANPAGLAAGSAEAQAAQKRACADLGVPVEVRTKQTGVVMRLIPAGTFIMGSPKDEAGRGYEDEYQVRFACPFWCGKFEVTQGQWQRVMGWNLSKFPKVGEAAPVETVSWDECQEFVRSLCLREGVPVGTYRLLTEAEWEYACRAGTRGPYAGDLGAMAWYDQNSGGATHPVGRKQPNAWGLHDMHGNVWEWCQTAYCLYPDAPAMDPAPPAGGPYRVGRGGSWGWGGRAIDCRSASRGAFSADGRAFPGALGLRIARTVAGP